MGLIGSAIGVVLGNLIAKGLLPMLAHTTAIALRLPEPAGGLAPGHGAVLLGAVVGITASLAAAILPALRLAFMRPVAALTMRGREIPMSAVRVRWLPLLGLVLVIAVLVVGQRLFNVVPLGYLTTGLLALTACLAASPVVRGGAHVVRGFWGRLFGPVGRLAAEQIGLRGGQASLTVATLAVGVGSALVMGTLAWSLEQTLLTNLSKRIRSPLVITSSYSSRGYLPAPLNDAVLNPLHGISGVEGVIGQQYLNVHYRDQDAELISYDPPCLTDADVCDWGLPPGVDTQELGRGDSVLISATFARQFGTRVGDAVLLNSPRGPLKVRVAAITNGQPERAVIMSRRRYRDVWSDSQLSFVFVQVKRGRDPAKVAEQIRKAMGSGYYIFWCAVRTR